MNFELSEDSLMLRNEARQFLEERCDGGRVRRVMSGEEPYAVELWRDIAAMGWLGAAIPEDYGGHGMGYEAQCVLAEALGRSLAPVPFVASAGLAAEAVSWCGSDGQKHANLPRIADGSRIGTLGLWEGLGDPSRDLIATSVDRGRISGAKLPVPYGCIADVLVAAARDAEGIGLYLVELGQPQIEREQIDTIDESVGQARIILNGARAERLAAPGDHWGAIEMLLERGAVLTAFEQLGGADRCLSMARDYALDRIVFGRPLASFQAIKHKLADIYCEIEIARSNAYYGAWALSANNPTALSFAASLGRLAASAAFFSAAKENIQVHGGFGFTSEYDCHLYYRRCKQLSLALGGQNYWEGRLAALLQSGAQEQQYGL